MDTAPRSQWSLRESETNREWRVRLVQPAPGQASDCERVLRSLPMWFGIEESLLMYVADTARLPTFLAQDGDTTLGFVTVRQHFPRSFEIHCMAVHADHRNRGIGRALLQTAQDSARNAGGWFMQIKTIAEASDSAEYAETRGFYQRMGYVPLEVFPLLWGESNPCVQLLKDLRQPL